MVLDHEHGAAVLALHVADVVDEPGDIAGADPGHRLVEQDDARSGHQEHGDLELALVAVRDVAGGGVELVAEPDRLELRESQLGRGIRSPGKAQQRVVAAE